MRRFTVVSDQPVAEATGQFVQQQGILVLRAAGLHGAGHLGAARHQVHEGRVVAGGQCPGDRSGRIRGTAQPDGPLDVAQPTAVDHTHHPKHALAAQPPVAAGHGVLRDLEHVGDRPEGGPAVDLQRVDQASIDSIHLEIRVQ
jgi:hypothetical protein